jgi:hypothetical protein
MLTQPPPPPVIQQHAAVWVMNEWMDPARHRSMRTECDDIEHPFASHPMCDRISGVYHEGEWTVSVSAQTMNPHQRVRVAVGIPAYTPGDDGEANRSLVKSVLLKAPLILFGKF